MRVRVLGAAAGGGFPQWNCDCSGCEVARVDPQRATPRTQSAIAVQSAGGDWLLVGASPDVAAHVETLHSSHPARLLGVALTDAELDHTLGLLRLRESESPLSVLATAYVRRVLTVDFPVAPMLSHWSGLLWRELPVDGEAVEIDGLSVAGIPCGGDGPRFATARKDAQAVVALAISDGGSSLVYAPAVARLDEQLSSVLRAADCVMFDGTCWTDDELLSRRTIGRTATAMGHLPLSGPSGSLRALGRLGLRRVVLVHINNTNPVLLDDSAERRVIDALGVEVAFDGLELQL